MAAATTHALEFDDRKFNFDLTMPFENILVSFFHCNSLNRLFIILKYFIKMLYTPYCDLDLILLLDKATGCFDWSFDTSKVPVSI